MRSSRRSRHDRRAIDEMDYCDSPCEQPDAGYQEEVRTDTSVPAVLDGCVDSCGQAVACHCNGEAAASSQETRISSEFSVSAGEERQSDQLGSATVESKLQNGQDQSPSCSAMECHDSVQECSPCEREDGPIAKLSSPAPTQRCNRVDVDESKFVMDEPRHPLNAPTSAETGSANAAQRKSGLPKLIRLDSSRKPAKPRSVTAPAQKPTARPPARMSSTNGQFRRDEELDLGLGPADVAPTNGQPSKTPAPQRHSSLADLKASVGKFGRNLKGLLRNMSDRNGASSAQRP